MPLYDARDAGQELRPIEQLELLRLFGQSLLIRLQLSKLEQFAR